MKDLVDLMDRVERYRHMFAYEHEAHQRVLDSLNRCPPAGQQTPAFQKAVDLMAHVAAARRLWLSRMGISQEKLALRDLEPSGVLLAELPARLQAAGAAWAAYLARLDEAELARTFAYQSFDSGRYTNVVEDIVLQLFGHSLYHRGQVALLIRQAGGEPAPTDYLFWTRQPA